MRSIWVPVATAVAIMIALTGCHSEPPAVIPTTAPTSKPVFANDEEALAAATKAYGEYQAMETRIYSEAGERPDRIKSFAEGIALEDALKGFQRFRDDQLRATGVATFAITSLQSVARGADGRETVRVYLCLDVAAIDVLGTDGKSIVSKTRLDKQPFEVELVQRESGKAELSLSSREAWDGAGVCA